MEERGRQQWRPLFCNPQPSTIQHPQQLNDMFQKIYWLLLLVCWGSACRQEAPKKFEKVDKYETGVVSRRTSFVDGKKEGKMTDYYGDGNLMAERWFHNDIQEGRT